MLPGGSIDALGTDVPREANSDRARLGNLGQRTSVEQVLQEETSEPGATFRSTLFECLAVHHQELVQGLVARCSIQQLVV